MNATGAESSPPPPKSERPDERDESSRPHSPSPAEALHDLKPRLAELGEYVNYYINAKVDALKSSVRSVAVAIVLGVLGLLVVSTLVITSVVLLCRGLAGAIGALLGGRQWAGDLTVSLLFIGVSASMATIGVTRMKHAWRERTIRKYASRQQHQRASFGSDVAQRADEAQADQ